MPSRKAEAKRQGELKGDFVLEGLPKLTRHAKQRMQQRKVSIRDVMLNKPSTGVVASEGNDGVVVTVIPKKFVEQQRKKRQERGQNGSLRSKTKNNTNKTMGNKLSTLGQSKRAQSKHGQGARKEALPNKSKQLHRHVLKLDPHTVVLAGSLGPVEKWFARVFIPMIRKINVTVVGFVLSEAPATVSITLEDCNPSWLLQVASTAKQVYENTGERLKTTDLLQKTRAKDRRCDVEMFLHQEFMKTPVFRKANDSSHPYAALLLSNTILQGNTTWGVKAVAPIADFVRSRGLLVTDVWCLSSYSSGVYIFVEGSHKNQVDAMHRSFDLACQGVQEENSSLPEPGKDKSAKSIKRDLCENIAKKMAENFQCEE